MHEMSLVQSLLGQVEALMREQQAESVVSIRVSVGRFSGVEPELFRSAYDTVVDLTPVRGAELELVEVPLESRCRECGHQFVHEQFRFECPSCRSRELDIERGEELILESVTLEQAEESAVQ